MDELTRVRELYGEPKPDPVLKARVGALLEAEARRRLRRPWTAAVAGLAAAVVAAVVIALPGGSPGIPVPTPEPSGRSILLAAAVTAESGPVQAGAYWRVRKLVRQRYPEMLGGGENRYWVIDPRISEQWVSRNGKVWAGAVSLGAEPAGPGDREAWLQDGSPAEWPGHQVFTAAGPSTLATVRGGVAFSMAGRPMTFAQIRSLPADPVALRAHVAEIVSADEGVVADALSGLLWSKPSPSDVRAAAYRALADLPNVTYLGTQADESGRAGAAFSFTLREPSGLVRRTLIIDTGNSQVISSTTDAVGVKNDQVELVLEAGWTNERPSAPQAPG
ncbi:CU044_5270 family protein [Acrocarpospora sp. B8E8]|uniref:CU044_5270 family protein n=1 Tax=Acrocarpospora sp. B8E8 TaxID=3153572 RepID=UPI00325F0327